MPHARVKTLEASLPTLVLEGRACLRSLRTHARGGSNSMVPAPGWAERVACLGADADVDADLVVESSGAAASAASAAEAAADDSGAGAGSGAAGASGIGLAGAGLLIFPTFTSMLRCAIVLQDTGPCVVAVRVVEILFTGIWQYGRNAAAGGRGTGRVQKNERRFPQGMGFRAKSSFDFVWWRGRLA